MKKLSVWAVVPVVFFCLSAFALAEMPYYPMMPGISSKYRVKVAKDVTNDARSFNTSITAVITRMGAETLAGKKVTPEKYEVAGEFASLSFVTEDTTGVYYVGTQQAKEPEPEISKNMQYLIKYPAEVGTTWKQDSVEFDMLNGDKKLPVQLEARIESKNEVVSVPAGTFANCLKVHMTGTTRGHGEYSHLRFQIDKDLWYAPGIGMIQVIQKEARTSGLETPRAADWNGKFMIMMQLEDFSGAKSQASMQ